MEKKDQSVCCFGELLLRYSPAMNGKFIEDAAMPVYIGGAELNAATALALWDVPVSYVTALPENYLAEEIRDHIKEQGIDTEFIRFSGERIGSYYLPQGKDLKNNAVIYDRKYSSFSFLKPGDIDWDTILDNFTWFHFSAISPALSKQAAEVCLEAVKTAAAKGLTVSVDLNYRAKLWQYGEQPAQVMPEFLKYCDVVMGNIWSAEKLVGIALSPGFDAFSGDQPLYIAEAKASAAKLFTEFPGIKTVANTFRFDKNAGIHYYATLHENNGVVCSREHDVQTIVDKIGSGDCFMGGLIYGLINNHKPQHIIDFAAAAAVAKLQQKGDVTTSKVSQIENSI